MNKFEFKTITEFKKHIKYRKGLSLSRSTIRRSRAIVNASRVD